MKKLIIIISLFLIVLQVFAQDDNPTTLQKNVVRISVNMNEDSTFFIDKLWYESRNYAVPYGDGFEVIEFFSDEGKFYLYFKNNHLEYAELYYLNKKQFKSIVTFINKNLFRLQDKKYKYRWVYFDTGDCYIMSTIIYKKEKLISINRF